MPLWLRKFTFSKIRDHYEQENQAAQKSNRTSKGGKNQSSDFIDFAKPDRSKLPKHLQNRSK
jgi:hypothetical protein